jgi:ABC-type branched-subunit amino acid transport system ATPase component
MTGVTPALAVENLTVRFGGVTALSGVSIAVPQGARHGILGPNGSGKTTLFNAITGFVLPQQGEVELHGQPITHLPAHRRVGLGLARTFQITTLFPSLTVREHVALAALARLGRSRDPWRPARTDEETNAAADAELATVGLAALADRPVWTLGYGEQRLVEIAVALTVGPRVLLLDEPTAGLSAAETGAVRDLIRRLPAALTVVLIEHDLGVVFDLAAELTVLHHGERIAGGPAAVVREDPIVKAVYLGG